MDGSTSSAAGKRFFEVVDDLSRLNSPGDGVCAGGGRAAPRTAGGGEEEHYLESSGKHCDGSREGRYELVACGCRSWFCPHCCTGRGLRLRERLLPILDTFSGVMMVTLTVDPLLFSSPEEAYRYVRDKRCISRLMRQLLRWGLLHSQRYFYVVEWQEKTQMAHFHLLLDASFIPFGRLCEAWNRFRPEWAGPVLGERPGFGSVRFSAPRFHDRRHACNYACAYLIKHPKEGYPQWVLDLPVRSVHRYGTSRGFWGDSAGEEDDEDEQCETPPADGSDCCPCCGHVEDGACDHCPECGWSVTAEDRFPPTIGERLKKCGQTSILVKLVEEVDEDTGELVERRRFVGVLAAPFSVAAAAVFKQVPEGKRRASVGVSEAVRLVQNFGHVVHGQAFWYNTW